MSDILSLLVFFVTLFIIVTVFLALHHLRKGRADTPAVRRANGMLQQLRGRSMQGVITYYILPVVIFLFFNWLSGLWMAVGTAAVWFYGTRTPPPRDRL